MSTPAESHAVPDDRATGADEQADRTDPRVDLYISSLPTWQKLLCHRMRRMILDSDPMIRETIKRWVQPHYVLRTTLCAFIADVDHVRVLIYDPTVPDPEHILNFGHAYKSARAVRIFEVEEVNWPALAAMLHIACRNNEAGGWRALKTPR